MTLMRYTISEWTLRSRLALAAVIALTSASLSAARTRADEIVPMTFPVLGKVSWVDSFNLNGEKGAGWRIHHGEDLMAAKMTPLVAAFDGVVQLMPTNGHNMLSIVGDNGYQCEYLHINDDTPGTHDHAGTPDYSYAPGLKSGDHVVAGQLVAWVGDSGNARGGDPHCHFELTCKERYLNPAPSLRAARKIKRPIYTLPQPQWKPEKLDRQSRLETGSGFCGHNLIINSSPPCSGRNRPWPENNLSSLPPKNARSNPS